MSYSEDDLVQKTTAAFLEEELHWHSVYAYNTEDYGSDSLLGRSSRKEIVLTRYLRQALETLNPGLPVAVYEQAVKEVVGVSPVQSLVAINKEKYELFKNGVPVSWRNEQGERKTERLKIFNFDHPEENHFLAVRELWVYGDLYNRRADVIGFVNGIPLLFIECKNIHHNLRTAYEKNYRDYKKVVPHLFHHNAFVVFANGESAKIGSITSKWGHFNEWKRLKEEEPGRVDMETLLRGVCSKANFMDLFENFILFNDADGEMAKIVARNHQYLGVNRALESVQNRTSMQGKLGVFWHTQGSGKSYSMVMFTRKIHRKLGRNFTFVILTDRQDLDDQIYRTFSGCGAVRENEQVRAGSGSQLVQMMSEDKSYVFSLIQKFNKEIEEGGYYTDRDDIIVITDEAHRTQYGTFAVNMRRALPNASFIGFTGTPLFKDDEITAQVFGEYVSTYDFQRAVDDNATVPLYYDARGEKLGITLGDINERIAEKLEQLEIEGIDVEQRLEREMKRDYHIITANKRLDQIAKDFVQHYSTNWETGKAMLVCIDKLTCVKMHGLIEEYWKKRIDELKEQLSSMPDASNNEEKNTLSKQIYWMEETIAAVVVSEEQGEVEKFEKWELDIIPHRRLMKEGLSVPERMKKIPKYQNKEFLSLEDAFKAEEHPFRIPIVCAMWLTGFDVPSLSTLYLDKPLKAHTLMQAIARANRVHEGKNNGLIVDYCGILKHLRSALATFGGGNEGGETGSGGEKGPTKPNEELLEELAEAIQYVVRFLVSREAPYESIKTTEGFDRNAAIRDCKEVINENDRTRKEFEIAAREVFKKFKACLTIEGVYAFKKDRDTINIIYKSLQSDVEHADISHIIRELHKVVDDAIDTTAEEVNENDGLFDISKIDFERLKQEFAKSPKKKTTVQELKSVVQEKLEKMLSQNPLRTDFQKRYEDIVEAYNREKERATIERVFEELMNLSKDLNEEESRAVKENLDEETLAIYDLLIKPELTKKEIKKIKEVAVSLLGVIKEKIAAIDQWEAVEPTRDTIRNEIYNHLYSDSTGLPTSSYNDDDVELKTKELYLHIYRAYPELPSPIYGEVAA